MELRQAESASREILRLVRRANTCASNSARVNAFGIIMNPRFLLTDLHSMRGEISKAIEMIEATKWPTDEEYDRL